MHARTEEDGGQSRSLSDNMSADPQVKIGGLSGQIEQIRDAIELPYLYAHLCKKHQLKPPKGRPALRPSRLR